MEEKTEVVAPAAQPEVPAPVTKESTPVTMETTPVTAPVTAQAAPGKHSEMVVLNKRKVCWANRDAFFACMDNNGKRFRAMSPYIFHQFNKFTVFYTLSLKKNCKYRQNMVSDNNQDVCAAEKAAYYDICPGSWVKHFNKLRIQSKYKSGIGRLKVRSDFMINTNQALVGSR